MTAGLSPLFGLVVGVAYGLAAQRGAFCLSSGFRNAWTSRDFTKVKALLLAVAIQMVALPLLLGASAVAPTVPSFFVVGAVGGGLLFGASMRWAAGCAAGVVYKVGGGSTSAIAAAMGMLAGAWAFEAGPLVPLRDVLRGPEWKTSAALGLDVTGAGGALLVGLGVVVLAALAKSRVSTAGAWTWRRTGAWLGVVGVAAWAVSALSGRAFGLAVIPGAVDLASTALASLGLSETPGSASLFDVALVVGIGLGAALATRHAEHRFAAISWAEATKRFVGGLGLGAGASLAAGCTVGHGLAGLPLLAPGSVVAVAAIFVGANLGPLAASARRRREAP